MSGKRQIFRVGTHTPMSGPAIEFTEAMLRAAVAAYDPAVHEAPIVVGHPRMDDPAYGWIKSLTFADGAVVAEEHQVEPQFAELREAGRFKKVSSSWYLPDAPANPTPGTLYLKHVGYLGAAAPAVKGLRSANFSASNDGVVVFGDWADSRNASLWRRMRELLIEKFGREDADKHLPDYEVQSLEEAARAESPKTSLYTEPTESPTMMTADQLKAKEQEIAAREQKVRSDEAAFAERNTQLTVQERAHQRLAYAAFADTLIAAGQMLPVQKDGVVAFMAQLASAGVVEFGEGTSKTSQPAIEWFKSFLNAQPKLVEFGERAPTHRGSPVDADDANELAKAAIEFQEAEAKAGRIVDVAGAVQHIIKARAK